MLQSVADTSSSNREWSPTIERLADGISERLVLPERNVRRLGIDRQQGRVIRSQVPRRTSVYRTPACQRPGS